MYPPSSQISSPLRLLTVCLQKFPEYPGLLEPHMASLDDMHTAAAFHPSVTSTTTDTLRPIYSFSFENFFSHQPSAPRRTSIREGSLNHGMMAFWSDVAKNGVDVLDG